MTESTPRSSPSNASSSGAPDENRPPLLQRLRTRLLLLVALAVAPMLGLVLFTAWDQRNQAHEEVRSEALRLTRIAIKLQEQHLEAARQLLSTLAQMGRWRSATNPAATSLLFGQLMQLHPVYTTIGAVDAEGNVIASGSALAEGEAKVTSKLWFQRVRQLRTFAVGDYSVANPHRKLTVNLAYPILERTNQMFLGAVYAALDFSWIGTLALESKLPENSTIAVLDNTWRVVGQFSSSDRGSGSQGQGLPLSSMDWRFRAGETTFEQKDSDGVPRLYCINALIGDEADPELRVAVGIPSKAAFEGTRRALAMNLGVLGGVTLLTGLLAWFGAEGFILRGIHPLLKVARELHRGNLSARSGMPHSGGELNQLAAAFDEMAVSLEQRVAERQRAEARLKSLNEDLERKVSERTHELQRSNKELEEFAYAASHDLQEPLRMITGHLQLLERRYKGKLDQNADDFIHFAVDGAKRMDQLIVDLLTYSRVGTHGQALVAVDLNTVVARARENLALRIEENKASIQTERLPRVLGDPLQLTLVFQNLLSNGIKFHGNRAPQIEINCVPALEHPDQFWMVIVKDHGIGIEPKYFDRLFQLFQRLHTREEYPGTGIGLAICKRVVERHGGKIWIESTPGEGTTFFFTLRRCAAA
ncbi:MAG: HAMP domain-containing protein [Verrucomicrobiales bacterium]|nr:HAMP domain-containing protein [Verrucomicrobiales bacterium]